MKAKGCSVSLGGNEPGFTLPVDFGELGDDISQLELKSCSLRGSCFLSGTELNAHISYATRTGPSLDEALQRLKPLAPQLQKLDLGGNELGGKITPTIAEFTKLVKLGLQRMHLEGACIYDLSWTQTRERRPHHVPAGDVSSETFSLLCELEWFDLRSNSIIQNTLIGFLSCNLTNIKDQKTIDASEKGLQGNAAYVCLSKRLNARILS